MIDLPLDATCSVCSPYFPVVAGLASVLIIVSQGRSCGVAPLLGFMRKGDLPEIVGNLTSINQTCLQSMGTYNTWKSTRYIDIVTPPHSASQLQNLPISFGPSPLPAVENSLLHQPTSSIQVFLLSLNRPYPTYFFPSLAHTHYPAALLSLVLPSRRPLSYISSVPGFHT